GFGAAERCRQSVADYLAAAAQHCCVQKASPPAAADAAVRLPVLGFAADARGRLAAAHLAAAAALCLGASPVAAVGRIAARPERDPVPVLQAAADLRAIGRWPH